MFYEAYAKAQPLQHEDDEPMQPMLYEAYEKS